MFGRKLYCLPYTYWKHSTFMSLEWNQARQYLFQSPDDAHLVFEGIPLAKSTDAACSDTCDLASSCVIVQFPISYLDAMCTCTCMFVYVRDWGGRGLVWCMRVMWQHIVGVCVHVSLLLVCEQTLCEFDLLWGYMAIMVVRVMIFVGCNDQVDVV